MLIVLNNPVTNKVEHVTQAQFNSYMAMTNGEAASWIVESDPMGKSAKSAEELKAEVASYRAKAAAASDPLLAKGYRALAKEAEADLLKYSPDQERDERGRFSSGGGDGSSSFRDTRTAGTGRTLSYKEVENFTNGSAAPYLVSDGKGGTTFTAERQALHEQIINNALEGVPKSEDPTLHLLGGGPASGKSTMLSSDQVNVPTGKEAVQINADDIKGQIPEYVNMVAAQDPNAAMFSHEESSYIAKEIQARAYANGQNVVLDGTGNSKLESLVGKIDTAHAYGYKVVGNYATVPSDVAVERANARAANPNSDSFGRVVPESVIREIHASVSSVFPQAAGKFDQVNLWDNSSKSPVLLATGGGGQLNIKDPAGYQAFLDKAKG